ncbi:radical SAM protein [Candidatus Lokiarchaeum ossiferum]|uniref:radical SAM protein n=1 Tax=Candidatus Lokiarchaeum ossiferum TaxID=2951803 RepID=UPI00352E9C61
MTQSDLIRTTTSICPECMQPITAKIVVDPSKGENGWVMMIKECAQHGEFQDIISKDPALYKWKNTYADDLDCKFSTKPINGNQFSVQKGCPYDCGLCTEHQSQANLMIIDVTNRCNLSCPICFANSNALGRIVEYSYEEVVRIMEHFIAQKPYPAAIAQFSGGEPTLHPRIIDILKKAKDLGFQHRMINTNAIKMARSVDFCRELKEAECGAIYFSFDAASANSPEVYKKIRGMDLTNIKRKAVENCREVGLDGIMLVVTVAKECNDGEIGAIMEFAKENNDVVAGVIFQPVSLCGRITLEDLMNLRYTSSDLAKELSKVTNGALDKFYPLAMSSKLTQLLIWFSDLPGWSISAHEDCGWATFLPIQKGEFVHISEYVEVEGLIEWANECWDMVSKRQIPQPSSGLRGLRPFADKLGLGRVFDALSEFTDTMTDIAYRNAMKAYFVAGAMKHLKNFEAKKLFEDPIYKYMLNFINDVRIEKSKQLLEHGLLMVGCMHFQDAYDLDVERVKRCVVHYGTLDPEDPQKVLQIPFCTFNTIHREGIEKAWAAKYSKPIDKSADEHAKEVQALEKSI